MAEDTPADLVPSGVPHRRLPVYAARPLRRRLALRLPDDGDLLFTDHYPVAQIPTVVTLHDCGGGPLRRWRLAATIEKATKVIAVSETVKRALCPAAVVVPNGDVGSTGSGVDTDDAGSTGAPVVRRRIKRPARSDSDAPRLKPNPYADP